MKLGAHTSHSHPPHHHYFATHHRPIPQLGEVKVKSISVDAQINRQASITTMVIEMENSHRSMQEGQALIPVPHGARC